MEVKGRRLDVGALIFGGIVLAVGIWFLLTETLGLDLPELDWDMIWPLFIIALGVGILLRAMRGRTAEPPG